jgi:hypothetical protein
MKKMKELVWWVLGKGVLGNQSRGFKAGEPGVLKEQGG